LGKYFNEDKQLLLCSSRQTGYAEENINRFFNKLRGCAMLNVNDYFMGKVKSIEFENGSVGRATIGVMVAGEYNFSTALREEMTVITGAMSVLLPGATEWLKFVAGETFLVPANSEFNVSVPEDTAYFCRYL
jgi:uncharacterized protein YaiE (UPF0345 family)